MPDELWPAIAAAPDADWRDAALCAQADPDAWFPPKGGNPAPAKRICAACPVRVECFEFALETGERFGIYGGKSERQRRQILADRARTTDGQPSRNDYGKAS